MDLPAIEVFEQRWISIEERLNNHLIIPLQAYLQVDDANYDSNFRVNPMNCSQWMPIYSEVYEMSTDRSPFNFCNELYAKVVSIFNLYHSRDCSPRVQSAIVDLDLFCKQLHRCICAQKILSRKLVNIFGYLNMYHVKYHHLPSIEEVGCESFTRNVLDPLIDIVENLELFIMVTHTANIIDPSRLPVGRVLEEYNNAMYRHLYPDRFWIAIKTMPQRLMALSGAGAVGLLEVKIEELPFKGFSVYELIVKNWLDKSRRLPEVVKVHILNFLVPTNFVRLLLFYVA